MSHEDIYMDMKLWMDFLEEEYERMNSMATTNKKAIIYDNNPNQSRFVPKGENVEIIGEPVDGNYIAVRYDGYNCLLKMEDLDIYESSALSY